MHSFCRCGFGSKWRESVRKHQADSKNICYRDGPVYEVDQASFPTWGRILQLPVVPYPGEATGERLDAGIPLSPPVQRPTIWAPSPRPRTHPATTDIHHVDARPLSLVVSTANTPGEKRIEKKHKKQKKQKKEKKERERLRKK